MKRGELSDTESVAELFKVSMAKTRRRLVRLEDALDWELVAEVLEAVCTWDEVPWPPEPLDGLMVSLLSQARPLERALTVLQQVKATVGDWAAVLEQESVAEDSIGLSMLELGHLRTVLRLVNRRFGGFTLTPVEQMTNDRAVRELTSIPGISVAVASTFLLMSLGRPVLPPTTAVRRVLTRLGVFRAGVTDGEAYRALAKVPAGLPVVTLFRGLTALASQICLEEAPRCPECPMSKLCAHGRRATKPVIADETPIFVDLFAGAGGMSYGLTQAGFAPALAVELEAWACATYKANHPEMPPQHVLCGDIREMDPAEAQRLLGGRRPDLMAGGPPCQGFSLIGKRGRAKSRFIDEPRNRLYKEYIRWVAQLNPRFVVIENVHGLYSYQDGAIREDIERNLHELGYSVDDLVVDTSRFGVPQRRQRVLFIGAATADFGLDGANRLSSRVAGLLRDHCDEQVTLEDAIADLPPLEAGDGREAVLMQCSRSPSGYARTLGAGTGQVLYHHSARPVNLRDRLLYGRLKQGEKAEDAMDQGARHLMVYQNKSYGDKYRCLRYDEPSPTIMSHLAKDGHMFIHPDPVQRRSITVREAARIQSFPDDFIFLGPRTHQFTQVGNAVPPMLARAIGEAIKQALSEVAQ